MVDTKKYIEGFPQSSPEMEEWQKKYKWDPASTEFGQKGAWYDPAATVVAPSPAPTDTLPEIVPGGDLPKEGERRMSDGVEYEWRNERWNPTKAKTQDITPGEWGDKPPTGTGLRYTTVLPKPGYKYEYNQTTGERREVLIDSSDLREKEIIGEDKDVVGTSDLAREEDAGTQEKIDIAKGIEDDQTETQKLTAKKELQDIREEMGLDPDTGLKKPVVPSYADDFDALRSEQGVGALETQVNTISSEIRDIEAGLRTAFDIEEGRSVWTRLIGKEKQKLQDEARESIDALNRRKQTLVDELTTKNTLISNIMGFKQLDYNAASTAYNQDFTQKVQLLNIVEGRIDRADQEANRQRDDARANLTILQNLVKDVDWSQVGTNIRTQIEALETKSGIPVGITEAFMRANPGLSVDYTTTGYDAEGNQVVSFFSYNDGIPKLITAITTGAVKPGVTEAREDKQSELDMLSQRIKDYMDLWRTKGDKGAGTREKFAADMAADAKHLTYQEIYTEVKRLVTDQWLEENKTWWRRTFGYPEE